MKRVAVAAMWLAACHRGSIVPDERPAPARADASVEAGAAPVASAAPADAGAKEPVTTGGPFVVVARGNELTLERVTGSPVLAVDHAANTLWELREGGEPHLVEALAEKAITIERSFVLRAGRVAGRWPLVQIEIGWGGGRGASTIHNWLVDTSKGTAKTVSVPFGHLASTSPWEGGVEIGLFGEDTSLMGGGFVNRTLALTTFGEPKKAVPKLPKNAQSANPTVAAYDTGRIFVLAGELHDDREAFTFDEKMVWTITGGKATALRVPARATRLLRGRTETETLVAGESEDGAPFLVRFDGAAFAAVPLPFTTPIRSAAAAGDGTVWVVEGPAPTSHRTVGGGVWRASFPELRFERVPLEPSFAPTSIGATSATDVWLVAEHPSLDYGALVLHTQAAAPATRVELPSDADALARLVYAKRELPAAGPTCVYPFFVLGKDGEVSEADAIAFGRADPAWPAGLHASLVRTASGDALWGYELSVTTPEPSKEDRAEQKALAARAKPRFAGAKLLCGRLPLVRDVEVVAPPPRIHKPPPGAKKPSGADPASPSGP